MIVEISFGYWHNYFVCIFLISIIFVVCMTKHFWLYYLPVCLMLLLSNNCIRVKKHASQSLNQFISHNVQFVNNLFTIT